MHQDTWQLQEAKAKLSQLFRAADKLPQTVSVRGEPKYVVMTKEQYDSRWGSKKPTLGELLDSSPLKGANLKIRRDKSPMRDLKLFDN